MKKFSVSFPYFLEYPIKVAVSRLGLLGFFGWLFQKFGHRLIKKENILVSERIIEIPSVYRFLARAKPSELVLEIGHVNSSLALELANLGFRVTAIDLRPYPFNHQNLTSIQADFLDYDFGQSRFDWIISVSTIEHLGYDRRYGGHREGDLDLDKAAFEKIAKLLLPDGRFILTVPYAAGEQRHWFKVYTRETIESLLANYFNIDSKKYYYRKNNQWFEVAEPNQDPASPADGVGIFLLSKK